MDSKKEKIKEKLLLSRYGWFAILYIVIGFIIFKLC
jgi:hypothetical protein